MLGDLQLVDHYDELFLLGTPLKSLGDIGGKSVRSTLDWISLLLSRSLVPSILFS